MPTSDAFEIVRPFAWMALIAFVVGFFSYFLLGDHSQAVAQDAWAQPAAVSGPASDDWNLVKHI